MLALSIGKSGMAAMEKIGGGISETGIKEFGKNRIENIKNEGDAVLGKLDEIKNLTPEQLREKLDENLKRFEKDVGFNTESLNGFLEADESKYEGLTNAEKEKIKGETGWSDEAVDNIRSVKESEIYKNAGLVEVEIGEKGCLIRTDIDWDKKYETGKYDADGNMVYETNMERIAKGRAPLDENGNPIELHHIGQHIDSP